MGLIKKFKEFKLIKEAEEENDEFLFDESGDEDNESEEDPGADFNSGDDLDSKGDEEGEFGEEGEEEEEEEEPKETVFNEDPGYYVKQALQTIQRNILNLFQKPSAPEEPTDKIEEKDPSKYYNQGVEVINTKITDMPMNKTLVVKYTDTDFTYQLLVTIAVEQGKPEKDDIEMDTSQVEEAGVKFKKYDAENNLIGELDKKKVNVDDIDQDFIDTLNAEIDEKYSVQDEFEIEYEDEDEKERE